VLVANRGEIALRVIRACDELGVESVAVYSDIDAGARHTRAATRAVLLGPSPAKESYLDIAKLIDAARSEGADAVHPGYGFLAENAGFAAACADAGLTFIGPTPQAIELMGSKIASRRAAVEAGLPVVPGETPADQTDAALRAAAGAIGFPLLIKASAGGGGKGMRLVHDPAELDEAISAARREAIAAFSDGTLYLERLILRPRHVEIQVFGDAHGNAVHLFERDCSTQRRHQKVIEESPSPALSPKLREQMGQAAAALAARIGYRGAGTVEFLLDGNGEAARFYFLEMNTRLQVEHPVTEAVTGVDLVRAQMHEASTGRLPWAQQDLALRGHAIECRVYAEDPARGFLPQAGPLRVYREPQGPGIRVDSGVEEGGEVSVFYDPLLAKLVVTGESREAARQRAVAALHRFVVLGIRTNVPFLIRLLESEDFREARIDTGFLDREGQSLVEARTERALPQALVAAAAFEGLHGAGPCAEEGAVAPTDPWETLRGWRNGGRR
jgi:acetyl-CoA carboxylase biotin carboxylase subunit